jgi:hypothetical protein
MKQNKKENVAYTIERLNIEAKRIHMIAKKSKQIFVQCIKE